LINDFNIIKWNINKKYLLDLEKKEINIVPSIITKNIHKNELKNLKYKTDFFIIKPIFGGSSKDVLYKNINEFEDIITFKYDMIIQPYIEGMMNGEYSLIYYGLYFSHMIVKKLKNKNDKILKFNNRIVENVLNDNQYYDSLKLFSTNVLNNLNILPNYTRIDLIIDNGMIYLLELELVDPNLFYENNDEQLKNMIINIFND
jgi:predicted ATP-grasp superfamily ATP-dependent carboligase